MKKLIIVCIAALFTLISCTGGNKNMNGTWTTSQLNYMGENIDIVKSELTIEINGSKANINGHSGVNRFFGEVKINKDKIIFGDQVGMTKMMGDPVSQNFEDKFIETLMHSDDCDLQDDILIIKNTKNNSYIKFTKNK